MRNINLKVSILQILALIFLVWSIQRLYIAVQAEKYQAFLARDWDRYESLTSLTVGELIYHERLWGLGAFLLGVLILGYVNWKNKIPLINIILTFILVLILFPIGFFSGGWGSINLYMDDFWKSMLLDYGLTYLIAGVILSLISLVLIIKSLRTGNKESTIHNTI